MVTARGEFAVRGGIVDIFPPTAEHPVRVEFWGDEVSELRAFTVADQRSTHPVDELDAPRLPRAAAHRPRPRAGRRARPHAREQPAAARAAGAPGPGHPGRGHGVAHPGAGRGRAAAAHRPAARGRAGARRRPGAGAHPQRRPRAHRPGVPGGAAGSPRAWAAAPRSTSARRPTATSSTCSSTPRPPATRSSRSARCSRAATTRSSRAPTRSTAYRGDIDRALVDLRAHVATGGAAVLVLGGHGTAQRAMEQLRDAEVPAVLADELPDEPEKGLVTVTCGRIVEGFTRACSWCSPRPTSPATAPRPPRPASSPRGGATPSTWSRSGPATTSCTPSTASAASSRCASARCRAPPASTWCWSTRRPSAASPPTASSCPPTRSTR